jgi:hypothetical protein
LVQQFAGPTKSIILKKNNKKKRNKLACEAKHNELAAEIVPNPVRNFEEAQQKG